MLTESQWKHFLETRENKKKAINEQIKVKIDNQVSKTEKLFKKIFLPPHPRQHSPGARRPVRWCWCSPTTPSWPTTAGCWWRVTSCSPWWAAPSSPWRSTSPGTSPWAGVRRAVRENGTFDLSVECERDFLDFAGVPLVVISTWGCAKYFYEDER